MATRAVSFDENFTPSFEEEWPELSRRLERFLAAKGVETWLRGDVVQETAARVYRKWWKIDHSRPLWNLVVTVALGILVDERRKASKVDLVPDVPQSDVDDVETRALYRVHIGKTHAALKKLRADQRRVLLAEIGEAAALDGSRNRTKVLRLRARLALRSELGPWAPAGVTLRIRSLRAAIERRLADWARDAHGVTASVASITVAATLLLPITGGGAGSATPGLQGSLPIDLEVTNLNEIREASLDRVTEQIPRPERPNLSRTKDRAKKAAENPYQFIEDEKQNLDDEMQRSKEWVEGQRQWTEEQRRSMEKENERVVGGEKERANGEKERSEKWAEGQKEWAEDQLPP